MSTSASVVKKPSSSRSSHQRDIPAASHLQRKEDSHAQKLSRMVEDAQGGLATGQKAEHQANVMGHKIAAGISSGHVQSGRLPEDIRTSAEKQLGVGLSDIRLSAGPEGQAKAGREGALAVTEGKTISFAADHLSTRTHAGRALLGHELTHVAQQARLGAVATQRQTPDGAKSEPDSCRETTIEPPAGHEERKEKIAAIKEELVPQREKRNEVKQKLDDVPKETSPETVAERKTLGDELKTVEDDMIQRLTNQIQVIDEAIEALRGVLPSTCAPGVPDASDVPQSLLDDLRNLEADKKSAEGERTSLKRSRTRAQIQDLQNLIDQLKPDDPERKKLEEQRTELGEYLSDTAQHRAAPGTVGKGGDGRGYVVYQHSVKVGGSLPWRNNNPGNVQRSKYGGDFPGVLGVDQYLHFIFSSVEEGKNAVFLDLMTRRGGPDARLDNALRSYIAGSQKDEDLPDNKEECASRGIPKATCVTKEAARTYAPKVTGTANLPMNKKLGELTPAERMALVDAIMRWEGGTFGDKGDEYNAGNISAPQEYRDLLGADE